jgi:hypothetical protein
MPAMGLVSVLSVAGHIGLPLVKNNRRGRCVREQCGTGCDASYQGTRAVLPTSLAGADLQQGISMLVDPQSSALSARPCLAINIRVFIDFLVEPAADRRYWNRRPVTRGSGPAAWPEARRRSWKLRLVAARNNPNGGSCR